MASKASKTSRRYDVDKEETRREWFDRVRRGVRTVEELSALVNDGTPIPNHYTSPNRASFLDHKEIDTLNEMSPDELTILQPVLESWNRIVATKGAPSVTDTAGDWSFHDLVLVYLSVRSIIDATRPMVSRHYRRLLTP